MKKNISLLFLSFLVIPFLAACNENGRPSLEDRISNAEVSRQEEAVEGTIKKLETFDVYQAGTHKLLMDDGSIMILQSQSIDLNRYLDEKVLIEGVMSEGIGDEKEVFTVTRISYLDEINSLQLKNYKNPVAGFSFVHPSTWLLEETLDSVKLSSGEQTVVNLSIFPDQVDLEAFADAREESKFTEVTVGAQKSLRFTSGVGLHFYVPNPPKKKIYLIEYKPTLNSVDEPEAAEKERSLFYDFLDSFELIYLNQPVGEKCGGPDALSCPQGEVCKLNSNEKDAEGVCGSIDKSIGNNCPFIAPPSCQEYRISEYSVKGCPARYECVTDSNSSAVESRDLNVVDAGKNPDDEGVDMKDPDVEGADNEKTYVVPDVSHVSAVYKNDRKGFSVAYPKSWYYVSFGPTDGALWKVGFADMAFEEIKDSLITLSIMKQGGNKYSKKINDEYYVLEGPEDLSAVMEKMLDSISIF